VLRADWSERTVTNDNDGTRARAPKSLIETIADIAPQHIVGEVGDLRRFAGRQDFSPWKSLVLAGVQGSQACLQQAAERTCDCGHIVRGQRDATFESGGRRPVSGRASSRRANGAALQGRATNPKLARDATGWLGQNPPEIAYWERGE
jgi:hypothetical protein